MVIPKMITILIFLISFTTTISQTNKNRIAVLDLESVGVSKMESITLTDRLRSELVKTGAFIIVERSEMNAILAEQGFQMSGCTSEECAVEAGKLLNVNQICAGSIGKVGSLYTISVRIIDIERGVVLKSITEDCQCPVERLLTHSIQNVALKLSDRIPTGKMVSIYENDNKTIAGDPRKEEEISLSGTIFYSKDTDIYKMDIVTKSEDLVYGTADKEYWPVVSPDKTKIAFASDANSSRIQVWIMDIDGSNANEISGNLDYALPSAWIGDQVLVNAYEPYGSGGSVYFLDLNDNTFQSVFYEFGQDSYTKRGWLDQNWIILTKSTRYGRSGGVIMKVEKDDQKSSEVLWSNASAIGVTGASISHDNSNVVFHYKKSSTMNMYIYNLNSGETNLLSKNANYSTWSPDDKYILFWRESDLWVVDLIGNEEQLTNDGISRLLGSWIADAVDNLDK